ncbi:MAG: SAM-dependent methyltransferase [uncultured bacterium]|nr:MAG: SAM-dependent methyltransferase [uncultured bacterium]
MKLLYDKNLTRFYDDITQSGYYDYEKEVGLIKKIVGARRSILELGSGTGNLLIPLSKAGFEVTGIDNSPHMIRAFEKKAKAEGLDIKNYLADQRTLSLNSTYDVVLASGGFVWFVTFDGKVHICTYSPSYKDIVKTFQNAYAHLNKDGLFLLNIQHHGKKFGLKLENSMDYHFEITQKSPSKIIKTHFIEDKGTLVFKRAFPQRVFSEEKALETAKKIGFEVVGIDKTKSFYVFKK